MKEIKSLRKEREKHFLKEDGSMVCYLYDHDIHYLKDGVYEEIDNTLVEDQTGYQNKANLFKTVFAKGISKKLVDISHQNDTFSISLKDVPHKKIALLEEKNGVVYEDILKNVDISYEVLSSCLKESILFKKQEDVCDQFTFVIDTSMDLFMCTDGSVDVKKDGEVLYKIEAPYMKDENGVYNHQIYYSLNGKELVLHLDRNWLKDETRAYPVVVDPTITVTDQNSISDTYIYPGDTDVNRNDSEILKVGVDRVNGRDIVYRTLLKFNLPTIGTGSSIISARAYLSSYVDDTEETNYDQLDVIDTHFLNVDWNEQTANWNNMNQHYDERIEMCSLLRRTSTTIDEDYHLVYVINQNGIDITNVVRKWYSGKPNYGILLKAHNEVYDANKPVHLLYSKSHTLNEDVKPVLEIYYRNQNGLEDYMSYETQSYTDGKSYVNRFTGNVTTSFLLNETVNGPFPVQLQLIYNTNDVVLNHHYGYGIGCQLNLHQMIREITIDSNHYLEYLDSDGTLHYFFIDNEKYIDQDGLGLEASKIDDEYWIKDKSGNTMKFEKSGTTWYLKEIIDTAGYFVTITYDTNHRITKVVDGSGEEISLEYTTNQLICSSAQQTTTVFYTDQKVVRIDSRNGSTIFSYNAKGLLSRITDITAKSIGFEYYDTTPYRIYKIIEYSTENNVGTSLLFQYGFDVTSIIDHKGFYNTYTFNENGNVLGITNLNGESNLKNGYGKCSWYYNGKEFKQAVNKLGNDHALVKYVANYLNNTSFEEDVPTFVAEHGDAALSTFTKRSGDYCMRFLTEDGYGIFSQEVAVPKGNTYTFSAYAENYCDCSMELSYRDASGTTVYESVSLPSNDHFERFEVSIDYPLDALSDLKISFYLSSSGTCYIDDVQLEEGNLANGYNYIDHGDFSNGLSNWTLDVRDSYDEELPIDHCYEFLTLEDNTVVLALNSDPYKSLTLNKSFAISGKKGDVYNLSFWYKNTGVNGDMVGNFNYAILSFDYHNNSDGHCVPLTYPFVLNDSEWQFFSTTVVAVEDYDNINLDILNIDNANKLYLTNFSLFRDVEKNSFIYDLETGNLTNVILQNKTNTEFRYNKNNQLTKMFHPSGTNFQFEYDNEISDRLLSGISSSGIANELSYDSFGNPVQTTIKNVFFDSENPSGSYILRLKGTKKYLNSDFVTNQVNFQEDSCSHEEWLIEKVGEYFRIKPAVISSFCLAYRNNHVFLSKLMDDSSLFQFEEVNNGSYALRPKDTTCYFRVNEDGLVGVVSILNENGVEDVTFKENEPSVQIYIENVTEESWIETKAEYSNDGKVLTKTIDALGNETHYVVDPATGLTKEITDPNGNTVSYLYDDKHQLTQVKKGNAVVHYQYNNKNALEHILAGNKEYYFLYDEFLNEEQIKINDQTLITNQYEENNGNFIRSTYGNNQVISYSYDEMDRLYQKVHMDDIYRHFYDNFGNLAKVEGNTDTYRYQYDFAHRLSNYRYNTFQVDYDYDLAGRVSSKNYRMNNQNKEIHYHYNEQDGMESISYDDENFLAYVRDALDRTKEIKVNDLSLIKYTYVTNGKKTSMIVKSIEIDDDLYEYRYNKLNNITHIYCNGTLKNQYEYDQYHQLVFEKDYEHEIMIRYTYDWYGNLLYKKEYALSTQQLLHTNTYEYSNSNWKDQLTKFNEDTITYDAIGNPLTIGNNHLTWINGRMLARYQNESSNLDISYRYNKDGIRIEKTVNGVKTNYLVEGNKILFEKKANDVLYYMRDENENLVGFQYNGTQYYYLKNIQQDIIGILNANGEKVVSYEYDSWGNILRICDANGNDISNNSTHIGNINPFRYRSYYYDTETKLYYLNSRYYHPLWGRFINADGYLITDQDLLSCNMYSYCKNNYVNCIDVNGKFFKKLWKKTKKALSTFANAIVANLKETWRNVTEYFTFEVGHGVGEGFDFKAFSSGIAINDGNELNTGYKKGKSYCSSTNSKGFTFSSFGYNKYKEKTLKCEKNDPPLVNVDWEDNWSFSVGYFEFSKNSIFIGTQFSFQFFVSGHVKIGWEIPFNEDS